MTTIRKADLAAELGVTRAAITQHIGRGMPVLPNGLVDREQALRWMAESIEPQQGRSAVRAAELLREKPKRDVPPKQTHHPKKNGHGEPELLNPGQERARRDRALSERLERENLIAEGKLCFIDDVVAQVAAELAIVRNRLLSLPSKCAPHLAAAGGPEQVRALLHHEIIQILCELSGTANTKDAAA